ncbi:unnamed protein product [Leptosia nina]|uniref:non-specific serine/threonine protein kinase n=1 Tax=Leptosia nina TaxID=320188 RepID=A0AAV1IWB5_9NEOP
MILDNINVTEENYITEKYWDTLDVHLKEFACPKQVANYKRPFKNDENVVQFPRDINKHGTFYVVPNSKKLIHKPWYHPERHVAKLAIDEQYSRMILRNLVNTGILTDVDRVISVGNKSIILHANTSHPNLNSQCLIKVFKTNLIESIETERFVKPDFRFRAMFRHTRNVAKEWAKLEFDGLKEIRKLGIKCPEPFMIKSHCVIMQYIGDPDKPAPTLARLKLKEDKWEEILSIVLDYIEKLYNGGLVHGDLSEHNILWWKDECWLLDVSQALPRSHDKALEYLWKDCKAVTRFFETKLPHKVKSPVKLYNKLCMENWGMLATKISES